MAPKLKDRFFTPDTIEGLGTAISSIHPEFDKARFLGLVFDDAWEGLELKDRMRRVSVCLQKTLPPKYPEALAILRQVADDYSGFDRMVFPDFVEQFGTGHWALSIPALEQFTQRASSEFGIRPFLLQDPERGIQQMLSWAGHENEHVRRLASEGCRPRLPWAGNLPVFQKDPSPLIPILDTLKNDPSEYVRRSVANNLNDISKDHPEQMLDLCERWFGQSKDTDRIVKHACRGLLKAAHPRALKLFGFADPEAIHVDGLSLDQTELHIGETVVYSFELTVATEAACNVRLECAVDYAKARGKRSHKVFQLGEREQPPGQQTLTRKLSFADLSTRKHYPGEHSLAIRVNGVEKAKASLLLKDAKARE